jgi:hypothetical protein
VAEYVAQKQEKPKKYTFIAYEPEDVNIDEEKGAKKDTDIVKMSIAKTRFEQRIDVAYENHKITNENQLVDKITKRIQLEECERSLGDGLSEYNEKSLEFTECADDVLYVQNDLYNMVMILNELRDTYGVQASYRIDYLPESEKPRRFRYLDNGRNVRKYLSAHIIINCRHLQLIEVERENRSLSTLIIFNHRFESLNYRGVV